MLETDLVLAVSRETGGATNSALKRLAQLEHQRLDAAERIRIAEIAPKATSRLMLWLPIGAVLAGQAIGIDVFAGLTQPLGSVSFALGLLLLWVAKRWMNRITKSAHKANTDAALPLDLLAIALGSGEPVNRALAEVNRELDEAGWVKDALVTARLDELVEHARETGESMREVLREEADEFRAIELRARLAEIEKTTVRLTLPLGLVALPAFALMSVVPAAIASLRASA